MSDGEVKIHVSADADTRALEDAKRKVSQLASEANPKPEAPARRWQNARKADGPQQPQERTPESLRKAADAYEAKGMTDAAKSARADATKLEREQAKQSRDRAAEERATIKAREAAEKQVTREVKEQEAMRRAGIRTFARGANGALSVGQDLLSGQSPAGALQGMAMASGNPAVIAAATVAALGTGLAAFFSQQADKNTAQGLAFDERRAGESYRRERNRGIFGSSSSLVSEALDADEEIARRNAARPGLEEKARGKWYKPSTWNFWGLRKTDAERELEVNDQERMAAQVRKASATKAAQTKYMREEGGMELDALRGRSKRTQEGAREAFLAEEGLKWMSKYKQSLQASGSESIAKEMADLTVTNDVRERQAQAGAGLVDAKSGGAETAAAAQWAMRAFPDVGAKIESLHATVQAQANPLKDQAK